MVSRAVIRVLLPLLAAAYAATFALEKTSPAPFTHEYGLLKQPPAYQLLIVSGACGLGTCVLWFFAKLLEATETMMLDSDPKPWWARTPTMRRVALASVVCCVAAQAFRT